MSRNFIALKEIYYNPMNSCHFGALINSHDVIIVSKFSSLSVGPVIEIKISLSYPWLNSNYVKLNLLNAFI